MSVRLSSTATWTVECGGCPATPHKQHVWTCEAQISGDKIKVQFRGRVGNRIGVGGDRLRVRDSDEVSSRVSSKGCGKGYGNEIE